MRVGILTYHSHLNYGALLQCFALKSVLEGLGHQVQVIDRWIDRRNEHLLGLLSFPCLKRLTGYAKVLVKSLLGGRDFFLLIRRLRTISFVRDLGLTRAHFYDWNDLSSEEKSALADSLDCIVVGSDQIWHGSPNGEMTYPFLLRGAPKIPAIAYAASIGERCLQPDIDYLDGFNRFSAISVRESEAVDLVKSTGYQRKVTHVVDPTQLITPDFWRNQVGDSKRDSSRIVCYFLSLPVDDTLRRLQALARKYQWRIDVLFGDACRPIEKSPVRTMRRLIWMLGNVFLRRRVRIVDSSGPLEFVQIFARAGMCVTDSFHAVMFSSAFNLNCRFLRPQSEFRKVMFSRIEEFARSSVKGEMIVDDLEGAFHSLAEQDRTVYDEKVIGRRREESRKWLIEALGNIQNKGEDENGHN